MNVENFFANVIVLNIDCFAFHLLSALLCLYKRKKAGSIELYCFLDLLVFFAPMGMLPSREF